jgi:hypothetical protein
MARPTKPERTREYAGLLRAIDDRTVAWMFETGERGMTLEEAAALFRAYLAAVRATEVAYRAFQAAVAAERRALERLRPVASDVRRGLRANKGAHSPALVAYDVKPAKVPYKSVATKAVAAEKARATRAARGTGRPKRRRR